MHKRKKMFSITRISDKTRPFINSQIAESWSGPYIVSRGIIHDTRTTPGFVALDNNEVIGYALYIIENNECEITVLESIHENQGVGSELINEILQEAKTTDCRRVWLITTNDNMHAIRYYQRFGFSLRAVHIDSMAEARKLKPQIPLTGNDGIPIAHEFEFEILL